MLRKTLIAAAVLLLAAGCGKSDDQDKEVHLNMPTPNAAPVLAEQMRAAPPPFVPPPDIAIGAKGPNALFSLRHDLTVAMARDAVAARFQAARDACLKDKALHCVLTSASLSVSQIVNAQLQVALPHDQVAAFERRLLAPLPQDRNGMPEITARSTSVENQTEAAADVERQLTQAVAYRDKLEELSKRPNLTVDEVIKIHEQLTEAQAAVETALAAKRVSDSDIRLEKMDIALEERIVPVARSAFAGFWTNTGAVFMASTAEMLLRIVNALPWLPLALVLAWIVARFVKRLRLRRGG